MPRTDLLALTADDLAALTNRGTVKRAQKELENNEPTCEIAEDSDGEVNVSWSDGITCRFLAGKTLHDAVCSSGMAGISRHIVRSVLAYQRSMATAAPVLPEGVEHGATPQHVAMAAMPQPQAIWDPGQFTDDDLIACFNKAAIVKARKRFAQGVLVELTRGAKPVARFLDEACMVRFMVPGDLRYATADCDESLWPQWIALAVWAFRELTPTQLAGLLTLQCTALPAPTDLLTELQGLVDELCHDGFSSVTPAWTARLQRCEQKLCHSGLVWPAELLSELAQQLAMHQQHDARCDPQQAIDLLGELLVRWRAIARGSTAVPQLLIRGNKTDRPMEISGGRFTGVGLGIRQQRGHVTLTAYLYETGTGTVVAVERLFTDPDPQSGEAVKSFEELAATGLLRGLSIGGLGTSQLLLQTGKRTPSGRLILPRTASSVTAHPQAFQWEQFKAPFAVESFAQLQARLRLLPPSYLRPRRCTDNLYGIAVAGVEGVCFDVARQQLTATLRDMDGAVATLLHPFHSRAARGFNVLCTELEEYGDRVRFVCGHIHIAKHGLILRPVLLITETEAQRHGIIPWIAHPSADRQTGVRSFMPVFTEAETAVSQVELFFQDLHQALADLLLTGIARCTPHTMHTITVHAQHSRDLGFVQLAEAVEHLATALTARSHALHWSAARALRCFQHLCLIMRLALE